MSKNIRNEIRLVGSGGQGIILATVILAEAAVIAGRSTAQSQAYGPEARGGSCKAEVLISDRPIGFTKVQNPTFLMALTQNALDQYAPGISEDCLVLIDSSLTPPKNLKESQIITRQILVTARDTIGKIQTANIVAIGCINEFLGIASKEVMQQAVSMHVPKGTEKLNAKALEEGSRLALEWKKEHSL